MSRPTSNRLQRTLHAIIGGICLFSSIALEVAGQRPKVTSTEEIRALSPAELDAGLNCEFEGTVIGVVTPSDRVLLQDGEHGVIVLPPFARRGVPPVGARIKVWGTTIRNPVLHVRARQWQVLDRKFGRPDAQPLSVSAAFDAPTEGRLVELTGLIQAIETNTPPSPSILRHRLSLQMREDNRVITVVIPQPTRHLGRPLQLATVRARGVLFDVERRNLPKQRVLWTTGWDELDFVKSGRKNPFALASTPLSGLEDAPADELLRIRGRVVSRPDARTFSLAVNAHPGRRRIAVWRPRGPPVREDDVVDVLGFVRHDNGKLRFESADIRWLGLPGSHAAQPGSDHRLSNYVVAASSIAAIRALKKEHIALGWPVRVDGVVSHRAKEQPEFYLERDNGGVLVRWQGTNDLPEVGQPIRIYGHVTPGLRHPAVAGTRLEMMPLRQPLGPKEITVSAFVAGAHTGGRLRVRGIVRSVRLDLDPSHAILRLDWDGDHVRARVPWDEADLPEDWVDARVELTGVAHPVMERRSSYPEEIILVDNWQDVVVLEPAPGDPFETKLWSIREVLRRSWREPNVRRLRVKGVVTANHPVFFIDDGTGGIQLRRRDVIELDVGDQVEVAGFPRWSRTAPRLGDVVVRKLGVAPLPPAVATTASQVNNGELHGRRVTLTGRVTGQSGGTLDLRSDDVAFKAVAPEPADQTWPEGATVTVTGVCQLFGGGGSAELEGFAVLLPSPNSVNVLELPSVWTPQRVLSVAGLALASALAALGWALFFRHRARQSQSQLLTTFHANPMPAWIIRRDDLSCVDLNAEFEKVFSLSRNELIGKRMKDVQLWDDDDARKQFLDAVSRQPSQRSVKARLRGRRGQSLDLLLSAEPVRLENCDCLLIIANDLTERLKLLEQLRQAQKMEAVGQLAAGVAHDFNNLLTIVRGNSGLIQLKPGLDEDTITLTREIEDAGIRAAELTSQLLAYSRKSVMQPRGFDLNDSVRNVSGMLSRMVSETIEVVHETTEHPLPVCADTTMIGQVLLNLGINARDAMPEGGRLSIRSGRAEFTASRPPENTDGKPGRYATIEVADTGCGMTADVLAHVFDPFFTTKEVGKGTGLGLSTAYGILRQHQGWIDVESRAGNGTKFTIYLPLSTEELATDQPAGDHHDPGRGYETILVVEDQAPVRQTVNRVLSEYGYQVLLAEDGPAAESIWKESADRVDLVLTDLVMPNGVSGLELARRLRVDRQDLKIIFMTGHSQELIEHGGQLHPGVDFLPKPFENAELVRMVRNRLDERTVANN